MPLLPNSITFNICYRDTLGRVRHVRSIINGTVKYIEFGKTESGGSSETLTNKSLKRFAEEVIESIPCNHD